MGGGEPKSCTTPAEQVSPRDWMETTGWEGDRMGEDHPTGGNKVGSWLQREVDEPELLGWFWRGLRNGPSDGVHPWDRGGFQFLLLERRIGRFWFHGERHLLHIVHGGSWLGFDIRGEFRCQGQVCGGRSLMLFRILWAGAGRDITTVERNMSDMVLFLTTLIMREDCTTTRCSQ